MLHLSTPYLGDSRSVGGSQELFGFISIYLKINLLAPPPPRITVWESSEVIAFSRKRPQMESYFACDQASWGPLVI